MRKVVVGLVVGLSLLGSQCSEPTKSQEKTPEAPVMIVISGPLSPNAPPQIAQKAWEINRYFDFISTMLNDFSDATPAVNGNIYTWEIPFGTGTIMKKIKAVRRSDDSIDWTVVLNGQADDSTLYSNRTLFIGKSAEDNSLQSWTFYDLLSGEVTHKIAWKKDKNKAVQLDDSFAAMNALWHMVNRSDGSGTFSYTLALKSQFAATWQADGSGAFTDYTIPGSTEESWN
jgi:hypothetical protein